MLCTTSSLFCIEKLIKFVSTRMWKGGPSWSLYSKNRCDGTWGLWTHIINMHIVTFLKDLILWKINSQVTDFALFFILSLLLSHLLVLLTAGGNNSLYNYIKCKNYKLQILHSGILGWNHSLHLSKFSRFLSLRLCVSVCGGGSRAGSKLRDLEN